MPAVVTPHERGLSVEHVRSLRGTGNGPVFDGGTVTSHGVLAWVNLSDLSAANGHETAISQDGVNLSRSVLSPGESCPPAVQ